MVADGLSEMCHTHLLNSLGKITISYPKTRVTDFRSVSINNQSFIDTTSAESPALGYGALGILGLGFTSLSSVDALLNKSGSAAGRSVLFNAFLDNPSEPNFISFALPREADPGNDVTGAVTIGTYTIDAVSFTLDSLNIF